MKSTKSVIKVVREWAQEICEEDDPTLVDKVSACLRK